MTSTQQRPRSRGARRAGRFVARSWQTLVTVVLVAALGVLAFISPGLVQADVKLNEGSVYVGNQDAGLIGTLNAQIDELANATQVSGNEFRILQDDSLVVVHGIEASTLGRYNPALNRMESPTELPRGAEVELAGGTMVVAVPDSGKVYHGPAAEVLEFEFSQREADFEVGAFGQATVTSDGQVIGLNAEKSVIVRQGDDGLEETPLPFQLDATFVNVSLSAVGDKAVVLDRQSGRIWLEGMDKAFEVSGASGAQLMAPAPDALGGHEGAKAIYATQAGLIALTSDGPKSLSGSLDAAPVRPVQVGTCVYAANGDQFIKLCRGQEPQIREIPELPSGAQLTFHVNRQTVVLNDMRSGMIWMVDKDMLIIRDWNQVTPSQEKEGSEVAPTDEVVQPDLDKPNRPPIAGDDQLGARAGRSTILPVLDNDSDPDGDVLTVTAQSELEGASLQTVRGGSGLQITIDPSTTGTVSFTYTIDDGRGGTDTATVTVEVLPADPAASNRPPFRSPLATPLRIQLSQKVDKRVLLDWRDPDGDSLILVDAWLPPTSEDELSFTPDGVITFRDIGKTTGTKKVLVKVSDGYEVAEGEMLLDVVDEVVPPLAFSDFETTAVDKAITINPLENDIGANLALTEVVPHCGKECTVTPNYREKWFTFQASKPGTYLVTYKVSNGPLAVGLVRIEVRAENSQHPPVAALDVALLPPGGSVLVDPLLNDTDEDGDVLVIQSVSQAPGLDIVLERRHLVTISASHTPDKPVTLSYRVSDGKDWALGTIVVIPTPATGSAAPQAEPDELLVRAGSTQAVDVVNNDISPVGLKLTLDSLVDNPLGDNAWVDGNMVRVSVPAGTQAQTSYLTYQVRDSDGAVASSQVRVTVVSEDVSNVPPVPRPVVERVLAGTTSRLLIPLEGVDANGDAVRLVGLGSGPQLGRVMGVGDGWLTYEAFPDSKGTDVFSYQVVDSYGVVGTGEVRVGVAPAGPDNSPPTAVTDEVRVRPGRPVHVPALRNDFDIDGDPITFASKDPVEIEQVGDAQVVDNREIAFTAPSEPGEYSGTYQIEDSRGMVSAGFISLTVDEEAPPLAPETRDDLVQVSSVIGKDYVEVDPLANDFDPDGSHEDLRVSLPGVDETEDGPRVTGNKVTVPVGERMQQIRYQVIDADGLTALGLILVPGRSDSVPVLKDPTLQLDAVAGQPLKITLNNVVAGTGNRKVVLTSVDNVAVTHGTTSPGLESIEYTPEVTYQGPASVVFEVKDVVPEGDKSGKRAYVSIPVKVAPSPVKQQQSDEDLPTAKSSPQLKGSNPVLQVAPDEGRFQIDLAPYFEDPDGDSFFFQNFKEGDGNAKLTWEAERDGGSRVFASAPLSAKKGTYRVIHAEVRDASDAITPFQLRLEVISSRRPRAVAAPDIIDEWVAGRELTVPVLANDKSNLLNNKDLKLLPDSAKIISGAGTIRTDGDVVKLVPAPDFVGTLTARYTINDATDDPDRRVDGTIRVTVKARPGRPNAPRDGQAGNGQVTFTYTPGPSNGYEISSRVAVALDERGIEVKRTECKSTTCTVTGLPNGRPYSFRVQEANQAGASDWSPTSAQWTPDQKPLAPAPPVVTFGDQQLQVAWRAPTWADPNNPGSPISSYNLVLTDDGGRQIGQRSIEPGTTRLTWTGLTNGTRYRFQVAAINAAGSSPWSEPSNVEYPAGPPGAVSAVEAVATQNELGGAFDIRFPANANPNGDPVSEYIVTPVRQNSGRVNDKAVSVKPNGRSQIQVRIEGLEQVGYRFEVRARNKAPQLGGAAYTPTYLTAWELAKVTGFTVQGGNGEARLSMTTSYDNRPNAPVVREYRIENKQGWTPWPANGVVTGLRNGDTYRFQGRVLVEGRGSESDMAAVTPRTPEPLFPTIDRESLRFMGQDGSSLVMEWKVPYLSQADNGGWDPAQYRTFCWAEKFQTCTPDKRQPSSVPATIRLRSDALKWGPVRTNTYVGHSGRRKPEEISMELQTPYKLEWNRRTKHVNVFLRYVRGATCTAKLGEEEHVFTQDEGTDSLVGEHTFSDENEESTVQLSCTWDVGQLTDEKRR